MDRLGLCPTPLSLPPASLRGHHFFFWPKRSGQEKGLFALDSPINLAGNDIPDSGIWDVAPCEILYLVKTCFECVQSPHPLNSFAVQTPSPLSRDGENRWKPFHTFPTLLP